MTVHTLAGRRPRHPMLDEVDPQAYFQEVLEDGFNIDYTGPSDDPFVPVRVAADNAMWSRDEDEDAIRQIRELIAA